MNDPFQKNQKPDPVTYNPQFEQDATIFVSYQTVEIQKMFGPLIFADIRVRANQETCEWIIERQSIKTCEWVEVARIPGQMDGEFDD